MVRVFRSYEYQFLRELEIYNEIWSDIKDNVLKEKEYVIKERTGVYYMLPDLWFMFLTDDRFLSFIRKLVSQESQYSPTAGDSLLSRYLKQYQFVELYLDNIFKYGGGNLPKEIFRCTNVKVLSLKHNFLEKLLPDIGQMQKLQYLALTDNRLDNSSIPYSLAFCRKLNVLKLDNNLLDALPGFLLTMPNLQTVHRHGNHNYFKATFMWYHTDINDRILPVPGTTPNKLEPQSLQFLCASAIIASKINVFAAVNVPQMLLDYICSIYFDCNVCYNCFSANLKSLPGYKVFTFKNPYLGNTCVPFQHWACSMECAEAIEIPAREEQILTALEQDRQYDRHIQEAQDLCFYRHKTNSMIPFHCCIL